MVQLRRLNTRYSKGDSLSTRINNPKTLKRQAFLNTILDEALEQPYEFGSFEEAISKLSQNFRLSMDEISYLKAQHDKSPIKFGQLRKK